MKRTLERRRLACVLGWGMAVVAVLLLTRCFAADKELPKSPAVVAQAVLPKAAPNEKANIEQHTHPIPVNLADLSKGGIESPTKRLLAGRTTRGSTSPVSEFVNPKVEPGKVRWHKTFADACTAAKKSGKPVLLFQMMGKLDDRFC